MDSHNDKRAPPNTKDLPSLKSLEEALPDPSHDIKHSEATETSGIFSLPEEVLVYMMIVRPSFTVIMIHYDSF